MSESLFEPIFVPDEFARAVGAEAWLRAMLRAEGALARAQAGAGVVCGEVARKISAVCEDRRTLEKLDVLDLAARARFPANPVPPLVEDLTVLVKETSEEAARHVHEGATSQDILDTAAMLVARETTAGILLKLDRLAAACARLAEEHRDTPMAGRTLMQQALPTTFGLKAAGWLVCVLEARDRLAEVRSNRLAGQLGGAAGTLASLGEAGTEVLGRFCRELDLAEPVAPWHTDRTRIFELSSALTLSCAAAGKISLDIILMSQTEVGELSEPSAGGRGGSSTLPHKRNPVLSIAASACARRVGALNATLAAAMAQQEHERAAGAWQSEWEPLSEALSLAGGAASAVSEAVEGLQVHPERMRENLNLTGGLLLAENLTTLAAGGGSLGRLEAHERVRKAALRTTRSGRSFQEEILSDRKLAGIFSKEELKDALDGSRYLGSARKFVHRTLNYYQNRINE